MEALTLAVGADGKPANPLKPLPGAHTWMAVLYRTLARYPQRCTVGHIDDLKPGDPIEFGADVPGRTTADGLTTFRDPRRWCGVVLEASPAGLVVQPCHDDFAALSAAYQWRLKNAPPRPKEWWEDEDADTADQAASA